MKRIGFSMFGLAGAESCQFKPPTNDGLCWSCECTNCTKSPTADAIWGRVAVEQQQLMELIAKDPTSSNKTKMGDGEQYWGNQEKPIEFEAFRIIWEESEWFDNKSYSTSSRMCLYISTPSQDFKSGLHQEYCHASWCRPEEFVV